MVGFLLGLCFDPEDEVIYPSETLTYGRLQGVISQMTVLFITTTVRISNPARMSLVGLEVLTEVTRKFWAVTTCSLVPLTRRYNPEE
jgi:hypothetical protein